MAENINTTDFINQIAGTTYEIRDIDTVINSSGDFKELRGIDAIINGITQILMRDKGSYIFSPEYGCSLFRYIFELNDEITKSRIKEDVVLAIKKYEPRVAVMVDVEYSSTNKRAFYLHLKITYKKYMLKIIMAQTMICLTPLRNG